MEYFIRVGTPDDAREIRDIYDYYVRETTATFNLETASVESFRAMLQETLAFYPFYVAVSEGRVIGFIYGEQVRPHDAYLWNVETTIYLAPDTPKRQGVGAALYRRFLDALTRQGFKAAFGVITENNTPSLAMHRALGFTEVGHFRSMGYKHGQWLGIVWMQKSLNPCDGAPERPIPFAELKEK